MLYKHTPVSPTQFDSMANNGYNINDIVAHDSAASPILLNPAAGIASRTPPPIKWYWRPLLMVALDLTVRILEVSGTARATCCSAHLLIIIKLLAVY